MQLRIWNLEFEIQQNPKPFPTPLVCLPLFFPLPPSLVTLIINIYIYRARMYWVSVFTHMIYLFLYTSFWCCFSFYCLCLMRTMDAWLPTPHLPVFLDPAPSVGVLSLDYGCFLARGHVPQWCLAIMTMGGTPLWSATVFDLTLCVPFLWGFMGAASLMLLAHVR